MQQAGNHATQQVEGLPGQDPLAEAKAPYVKVRSLGAGAFGSVQLARHATTKKEVAIKFLHRTRDIDSKYVEGEVLNHRMLRHCNVIKFKEVFLTPKHICIVMEFANGGSLLDYVRRKGKLDEPDARGFFQQLIVGLDYCHRKGVVNRDIKLENVLLQELPGSNLRQPLVKICDFGYSKDDVKSAPKSQVGTVAYMAPEVLHNSAPYDGKLADIWSCGVMLYTMLCGNYPFGTVIGCTATVAEAYATYGLQRSIPSGVTISPACLDLLSKLLAIDPQQRLTMSGILAHPWFLTDLPPKAVDYNDSIVGREDYSGVQTIEEVKAVLERAELKRFASARHAADVAPVEDQDMLIDAAIDADMLENEQSFI